MKVYYSMDNIGTARYIVNYHDGISQHRDGSPFYDMAIFKSAKARKDFITTLQSNGYEVRE